MKTEFFLLIRIMEERGNVCYHSILLLTQTIKFRERMVRGKRGFIQDGFHCITYHKRLNLKMILVSPSCRFYMTLTLNGIRASYMKYPVFDSNHLILSNTPYSIHKLFHKL